MKFFAMGLRWFCWLAMGVALRAEASAPTATAADRDYAAFEEVLKASRAEPAPEVLATRNTLGRWLDAQSHRVQETGLAFYAAHPNDARRWLVVAELVQASYVFVTTLTEDGPQGKAGDVVNDQPALDAWQTQLDGLATTLLAASDVPELARERVEWARFMKQFRKPMPAGMKRDWPARHVEFLDHLARYPRQPDLVRRADDYLKMVERTRLGASRPLWEQLRTSESEPLRTLAATRLAELAAFTQPVELAFKAIDGREVDLARLRGKVVLLDFWATWCGPCIAELPTVRKVYDAYHAQGFEVVAVSLDRPADRQKLANFVARENIPWPQYHDLENKVNPLAKRFQVTTIPAMLLLDQDGRIVSTNARGPKLEAEVKRLLKR